MSLEWVPSDHRVLPIILETWLPLGIIVWVPSDHREPKLSVPGGHREPKSVYLVAKWASTWNPTCEYQYLVATGYPNC